MSAEDSRQEHVDNIVSALKHAEGHAPFDTITKAYMSLGWLSSEMQDQGRVRNAIDVAEDDAIRISNREPLIGG